MSIRTGSHPSEDEPNPLEAREADSRTAATPVASSSRYLLAWLPDPVAVMAVLGRPPKADEDTASANALIAAARKARATRTSWITRDPRVTADRTALDAIAARNDIQAAFASMIWEPSFVDLTKVLSIQQLVNMQGLDARVALGESGSEALTALCLPTPGPENLEASVDGDGLAITLSSANPNLRVTGLALAQVAVAGDVRQAVQMFVGIAASYLQVAEYRGRYFLRDGYHRAVGLLRRSTTIVPAVVIRARTQSELTPLVGLFGEDVLFDDRPPALVDFLDDSVAYTGTRKIPRRFIRVRADQFIH